MFLRNTTNHFRFGGIARLDVKLECIGEQVDAIADELVRHRFGAYYRHEGAAEVESKQRLSVRVVDALRKRPDRFGDLLYALQPSPDQLRALYLRVDDGPYHGPDDAVEPDDGGLIDLGSLLGGTELAPADERPTSIADAKRPVFAPPPSIAIGELPELTAKPANYSGVFIVDWFEAFKHLAINNAGHAAGRDISPEQNARLGEILEKISGGGSGILTE